ncbi:hypothetical protein KR026_006317 [Drosophila bipectinata]|nr:hypothetical protein KR026_006317 [Drosophila bipectinata]
MRSSQSAFVALLVVGLMEGVWSTPTHYTTQAIIEKKDLQSNGITTLENKTIEPVTETTELESFESTTEDETPTTDVPTTESIEIDLKIEADWQKFLTDFSVTYKNESETEKHRKIFTENWKMIQEHNEQYKQGKQSYKMKINQFADLNREGWKAKLGSH